jgi:hypothetical protein
MTERPSRRTPTRSSSAPAANTPAGKRPAGKRPAGKNTGAKNTAKKPAAKNAGVKNAAAVRAAEPRRAGVDWRSLYLYAVSLITLLICLFAVVSLVRAGLNLALPSPGYFDPYAPKSEIDPELVRRAQLDADRRNALRSILDNVTMLVVTAPLYWYHWRAAQRERD